MWRKLALCKKRNSEPNRYNKISKKNFYSPFLQKEAGKTMIEKFRQHAQEQKTKIEDLGIIQQKRGGKRKRKNY